MQHSIKVKTGSDFGFLCDSSKLSKAITKALTVSSFSNSADGDKHHMLISSDGNLYVVGYSSETFILLQVDGVETDGNGALDFVPTILQGLIKNRNELSFKFSNGRLEFKAVKGKYSGSINTNSVDEDQLPHLKRMMQVKSKSGGSISGTMIEEIRKGVKCADLKDYYNDEQILCAIRVKDGQLDVSSHDNFHMSYYKSEVEASDNFSLAVPVVTFKLIDKFISDEKEDADFHLDNKQFKIVGKSYMITLPPVQVEDDYFDRVPGYIKTLKNPLVEMKFNADAIRTVDNMFTISDEDTRLSLTINESGKVGISLATDNGKISDAFVSKGVKIDGEKEVAFMIDPRIFSDLFGKVRDRKEVPMRLFSKRNKGVSSCFMISASTKTTKAFLVGTYYEE
jgi:hypothetical protein